MTGNDCAPIVAVADTIVIFWFVSLFPIDHVTTWSPFEHVVEPDRTG